MKLSEEQIKVAFAELARQKKIHETLGVPEQQMKNYRHRFKSGTLRIGTMLEVLNEAGKLALRD